MMVSIEAICASKLYRASTRKQSILAAAQGAHVVELVIQSPELVDKDELLRLNPIQHDEPDEDEANMEVDFEDTPDIESDRMNDGPALSNHSLPRGAGMGGGHTPDFEATEPSETPPDDGNQAAADEPVSESSMLNSDKAIYSSTSLDVMKGSLNSDSSTSGVSRIAIKDNELWIYYQDSINLNNLMTNTIDMMSKLGYSNAEFNRLARTDNAIVFQINYNDTGEDNEN